jgi:C1A family cysteine protease
VYNYGPRFWYRQDDTAIIGTHAVTIVGYNANGFVIRNSWGLDWNNDGYTTMRYGDFNKGIVLEQWIMADDKSNMIVPIKPECKCVLM